MKYPFIRLAAAALPLVLGSTHVFGSDLHWSASIAAGLATAHSSGQGAPSSPHWSARIGTGQVASDANEPREPVVAASRERAPTANPHWSAKIGTARTPS